MREREWDVVVHIGAWMVHLLRSDTNTGGHLSSLFLSVHKLHEGSLEWLGLSASDRYCLNYLLQPLLLFYAYEVFIVLLESPQVVNRGHVLCSVCRLSVRCMSHPKSDEVHSASVALRL